MSSENLRQKQAQVPGSTFKQYRTVKVCCRNNLNGLNDQAYTCLIYFIKRINVSIEDDHVLVEINLFCSINYEARVISPSDCSVLHPNILIIIFSCEASSEFCDHCLIASSITVGSYLNYQLLGTISSAFQYLQYIFK